MTTLSNSQVLAGQGTTPAHNAYRALVAGHGHDSLCEAYGLDIDSVNGGTHWADVVRQALAWGDIEPDGTLS